MPAPHLHLRGRSPVSQPQRRSGGNSAKYSVNNVWCVQLMNARRPSHKTASPTKFSVSIAAEVALSPSEATILFVALAKEQLITHHSFICGQDRLPGYAGTRFL